MVDKRTIGVSFFKGLADVKIWAPLASKVEIILNNSDSYSLSPADMGFWQAASLPVSPGDNYSIIVDGKAYPDPASLYQPTGVHHSSQAFDVNAYSWHDADWKGIDPDELIIYELHTGTFTQEGTFAAIISKLGYLKQLGITAIELMPVAQFPGSRNWGYDGVYPFAVQNTYGGPEGLQKLVDACHQIGLAVILDVVYNHLGPEGNYLPAFGPVFTDKYRTPWGQALNFDDAWCDGIREIFTENALMWLRDFHVDGLRMDAVHAIKDFGPVHILRHIREKVVMLNSQLNRKHFLIVESDLNDVKYLSHFSQGGYCLDATWCDEFHHAVHALVTGEQKGYYSDFGSLAHLEKAYNNGFVYDGIWSPHRKRVFGSKTTGMAGHKFVVFSQNHDQVGNRMFGDRLSSLVNFEMLKVIAGTFLLSPFTPLLFMGEEYAETNPFLYFISHEDEKLVQQVRDGRKDEFKAFISEGEPPDPQSMDTFYASKLNWDNRSARQEQMFEFYRELIRLRKTNPVFVHSGREGTKAESSADNKVLRVFRQLKTQKIRIVFNFWKEMVELPLEDDHALSWQLILSSADKKWGGPGHIFELNKELFSMPPQSMAVFST